MSERSYWFADVDTDRTNPTLGWQPCLQNDSGCLPCFDVWFATEQECLDWIRRYVVGADVRAGDE